MATVTDPIILDSTGQAIKNSIDLLSANINRTASNIPYDDNLTIKAAIDGKVSKSGDTMTGNLNIKPDNTFGVISLGKGSNSSEYGIVQIYDDASHWLNILPSPQTDNRMILFPDKSGTVALTSDREWTLIASDIIKTSPVVDISNYYELWIVPKIAGTYRNAPIYTINLNNFTIGNTYREGTNLILDYIVRVNSNLLTVDYNLTGWASVTFDIYGR